MGLISIDGNLLRKMIICGANELTRNSRVLDGLNVFPVPDGDTGINMSHTVQAAAREVYKLNTPNISDVAKAASGGSLRGARGNSGVILSQIFRGFAKGLDGRTVAGIDDLAGALVQSAETAYKAVMKPKEGTILTIARVIGEVAFDRADTVEDVQAGLDGIIHYATEALNKTTDMLPELKQAGVVDAGGMGLLFIFQGARAALSMTEDPVPEDKTPEAGPPMTAAGMSGADIRFAYCTEFLIEQESDGATDAEPVLQSFLSGIGDSIVVVADEGVIKIHVHTNHPGKALEKALQFGMLSNIKIENMKLQHTSLLEFSVTAAPVKKKPATPPKPVGFVAVAAGAGLGELFIGLGVDQVIEGGQSMNPSAEDVLKAVEGVNAENVVILPNNKNIILTAQQAVHLNNSDKRIHVIPTRSIPQGVSCMVNYIGAESIEESLEDMNSAIERVHSGGITAAVRDTVLDGLPIREGDILCMYDGDVVFTRDNLQDAAKALLAHMMSFGGDVISVYYGEGVTEEMAEEISAHIGEAYPDSEAEVYNGQQPLYNYILSVE